MDLNPKSQDDLKVGFRNNTRDDAPTAVMEEKAKEGMVKVPDSERLTYRLLSDSGEDADLMWQLDQDPAVMQFINGGRKTSRQEIVDRFLPRMRAYRNPETGWGLWGVFDQVTNQYFGWILIRPMGFFDGVRDDRNLEIGWRFHQATWGKGYATEAAKSVAASVISAGQCDRLSAIALPENTASIQVMKKLGLKYSALIDYEDEVFSKCQLVCYSAHVEDVVS